VKFAELGWLGLLTAEDDGGLRRRAVETMIVMEAFGSGLVVEPFIPAVVVAGTMLAAAGGAGSAALLADAIAGERIVALAYAERAVATTRQAEHDRARRWRRFHHRRPESCVRMHAQRIRSSSRARTDGAIDSTAGDHLTRRRFHADGIERRDYVTCDDRRRRTFRSQAFVSREARW